MNRYDIRNKQNGKTFSVKAETAPTLNSEWGADPEIIETNIDAEVAAGETKKNKVQALKARLKSHDASAIPTLAAMKPVLADVLEMLNELIQ